MVPLHARLEQVALVVYLANLTNTVPDMISHGIPVRLAIFITLPFQVFVLDYLLMPLCSMLLDKWLSKPQKQVCATVLRKVW